MVSSPYPPATMHFHDALLGIADTYGTPTYAYDEATIRAQCRRLRERLSDLPTRLLYAMKANSSPAVMQIIREEGFGIDAVSPGEWMLARRTGFAPEQIFYSTNNMTDAEMHAAASEGLLFNIGEISRLDRFGHAYPGREVCVRINPQVGAGHHSHVVTGGALSKFGIPVEELGDVRAVCERHGLRLVGLHQHIGSGILDTQAFWQALQVILDAAATIPDLRLLNVGGGLGIPYKPGEPELDLDRWQELIVEPLRDFHAKHPSPDLAFWFEPGRFLVAQAGVLLTQVNTLKLASERRFAGTDTGFNHLLRPTMYGAYHGVRNLSHPDGEPRPYDVVGNICESGDVFARDREVAEIREGDVLGLMDAGAYGMAMASTYNLRPLPAEVLRRADGTTELLRARRTPEDLVAAWVDDALPEPLA